MIRNIILSKLEELSSKTLGNYSRKASKSSDEAFHNDDDRKYEKRRKGLRLAKDKMNINGKSKIGAN